MEVQVLVVVNSAGKPNIADFRHRLTKEVLWIGSTSRPQWVKLKMIAMARSSTQTYVGSKVHKRYFFCHRSTIDRIAGYIFTMERVADYQK